MKLGDVVQLLRNRARSGESGLDEVIIRSINSAIEEVVELRPWWWLWRYVTVSTDAQGQASVSPRMVYSPQEYGVLLTSSGERVKYGSPEESGLLSGSSPQVWMAWADPASNTTILKVWPAASYSGLQLGGYFAVSTFNPAAWDPNATNPCLEYASGLVITRAWIEVAHYLGRMTTPEAHRLWIEYLQTTMGIAPEATSAWRRE